MLHLDLVFTAIAPPSPTAAAVAATAAAAAAAEQHLRLNSLVSVNKSSLKRRAEREAVERRQMEKEEKDTKSFLMQLEAFRWGVNYSLLLCPYLYNKESLFFKHSQDEIY